MSLDERRIHVGVSRRGIRQHDGSLADLTINLSGIPDTAGPEVIGGMLATATTGLAMVLAELDERVRQIERRPSPPAEPPRIDASAFASPASLSVPAPGPAPEPAPIPRDEEVGVDLYRDVLGVRVPTPPEDWQTLPISDGREGGGSQLVALNAGLTSAGIAGPARWRACEVVLAAFGPIGPNHLRVSVASTRDLTRAEAHVMLSWLSNADVPALAALRAAIAPPVPSAPPQAEGEEEADPFADPVRFPEDPEGAPPVTAPVAATSDAPTLSPDQRRALDRCLEVMAARENAFVFVTGKAGTGKSTVLRELRRRRDVIVVAPTGLAAVNVGGQTIHSFFGFKTGPLTRSKVGRMRWPEILQCASAVVIDEVSMVRADLLDAINVSMQRTLESVLPFGGLPVIAFGDLMQLEPVVTDEESDWVRAKYRSPFWFDAGVFRSSGQRALAPDADTIEIGIERFELRHVFRQRDQDFVDALNLIRLGDPAGLDLVNRRVGVRPPVDAPPVALTFTNRAAVAINLGRLAALGDAEGRTYSAEVTGEIKPGDVPVEAEINLKVGARVMFAKNVLDEEAGRVSNGALGHVVGFDLDGPLVRLDDGRHLVALPAAWEKIAYTFDKDVEKVGESVAGGFTQVPLKLAWAITTHKAQGQTLDSAILELESRSRTHGQLYVALSRVRSMDGLYLRRRLVPEDLVVDPRVREFCGIVAPVRSSGAIDAGAFAS